MKHGLRACWSTPAKTPEGEVVGTFAMYYSEPKEPSDFDRLIIASVTRVAVLAIERSRHMQALIDSHVRLSALCDCSPVGIFVTDVHGNTVHTSPSCRAICGFSEEEAAGNGWLRFVHPADASRVMKEWNSAVRRQAPYETETRWMHKDGSVRWTVLRAAPVKPPTGAHLGFMGTVGDLTERLATGNAALTSRADLNAMFDSAPAAIIYCDMDLIVRAWNGTADSLLGWKAGERLGRELPMPSSEAETWAEICREMSRGRSVSGVHLRQNCKNGRIVDAEVDASPVVSERGQLEGFVIHLCLQTAGKDQQASAVTN